MRWRGRPGFHTIERGGSKVSSSRPITTFRYRARRRWNSGARVAASVRGARYGYALALYWFEGYGGGIWLPFGDSTNGTAFTARPLTVKITIKGADLGASAGEFMLDFNFAYNPSCTYDDRWSCPLPPAENKLPFDVPAEERVFDLEDLTG